MRPSHENHKSHSPRSALASIRAILILQLAIASPLPFPLSAHAEESQNSYSSVCDPINARQSLNTDPTVPVAGFTDCETAKHAEIARQRANTKAIMFGALGTVCAGLAAFEFTGQGATCTGLSLGGTGTKMLIDDATKKRIKNDTEVQTNGMAQTVNGIVAGYKVATLAAPYVTKVKDAVSGWFQGNTAATSVDPNFIGPPDPNAAVSQSQPAGDAAKETGSKSGKGTCLVSSALLLVEMGMSIWEAADAKKIHQLKVDAAKANADAAASANGIVANFSNPMGGQQNQAPGAAISDAASSEPKDQCKSAQGNSYLTCTFQGSNEAPAIAALVGDSKVNRLMENLMGGKTLGDLAKSYNGDGSGASIGNHIANALGMPNDMKSTLSTGMSLAEKATRRDSQELPGATYASKGSSPQDAKKAGEVDFSKMMEGLLKQMSPEEKAAMNPQNASEAIFRKLDLLPPDKIEANRDISLFVRIGYRYTKKAPSILSRGAAEVPKAP